MKNDTGVIQPADFLLPAAGIRLEQWACIACDQYTSEPEYWREVEVAVGNAPSCYRMILPECFLEEAEHRLPAIQQTMQEYCRNGTVGVAVEDGFVLVERTTESGTRLGLVCVVDLEEYDFDNARGLVRPTEETIASRIPARMSVRRNALVECSHILLLMDDPQHTVIEPIYAMREQLHKVYDFPLMLGGGYLRGWAVTAEQEKRAIETALKHMESAHSDSPMLFAVGDGNHSLATAKAYWNELKKELNEESQHAHPARFAMVEVENIHDESLKFEPIHRVVMGVDEDDVLNKWKAHCTASNVPFSTPYYIEAISRRGQFRVQLDERSGSLPVAFLQDFLDEYLENHPEATIDYIHGEEIVARLVKKPGTIGFLLPAVSKQNFFSTVCELGVMPRKAFSMGHAHEKRYYVECRYIRCR